MGRNWSQEDRATIASLWKRKRSASEIGAEYGVTRSAIIGMVARAGLQRSTPEQQAAKSAARRRREAEKEERKHAREQGHAERAITLAAAPKPEIVSAPRSRSLPIVRIPQAAPRICTGQPVALMALQPGDCRWPLGDPHHLDFRFCGGPAPFGTSYCSHHRAVAYQPPQVRGHKRKPLRLEAAE